MNGKDVEGVTDISLQALKSYKDKKLKKIYIESVNPIGCKTVFFFEDGSRYEASGFNIGYGGEGPRGLHTAIQMLTDVEVSFQASDISKLDRDLNWEWTPEKRFKTV